jgi:hypothetical protein
VVLPNGLPLEVLIIVIVYDSPEMKSAPGWGSQVPVGVELDGLLIVTVVEPVPLMGVTLKVVLVAPRAPLTRPWIMNGPGTHPIDTVLLDGVYRFP